MASLSVAAIPKILALIFLVCLTRVAAGSCLSYGHSCWGGHGKRSTTLHHIFNPSKTEKRNDDWYFSKFLKVLKEKPADSSAVYNQYIKDFGIFDKLITNGHLKHSIGESTEQEAMDLGNEIEEEPENDMDAETIFLPDEDDLIWNSKSHIMKKIVDKARKTSG